MSEAERIAAGLTEAQQREVLSLTGDWTVRRYGQTPPWLTWLPPSILETTSPTQVNSERLRLTPLGLAVRATLNDRSAT